MSIRRRSTVHDLAALRMHPDGSRVRSGVSGDRKLAVKPVRHTRRTGKDVQGNVIALDAGGSYTVKQRRSGKRLEAGKPEDHHQEEAEGATEQTEGVPHTFKKIRVSCVSERQSASRSVVGEGGTISDEVQSVKDSRAKKRRKFYHDFTFLSDLSTKPPDFVASELAAISDAIPPAGNIAENRTPYSQLTLPVPSSDLLKYIHYYATGYFTSRGCLFNAPRKARETRKLRKLMRLRNDVARKSGQHVFTEDSSEFQSMDDSGNLAQSIGGMIGGRAEGAEGSGQANETKQRVEGREGQRKVRRKEKPKRDMYKAFDGSALMAFGILLQEHVMEMLSAEVPEEWLRQMEAVGPRGAKHNQSAMKVEGDITSGSIARKVNEDGNSQRPEEAQESSDSGNEDDATSIGSYLACSPGV